MKKSICSLFLSVCLLGTVQEAESTTTSQIFAKYPNRIFVESGTFTGDGVKKALNAGFEQVYSIELSEHYYQLSRKRYENYPNVVILQGDSGKLLATVLDPIDEPVTFWLDGHYSVVAHAAKGDTFSPILAELECIKNHPIKTHTLLIDDVRLLGTLHFDWVTLDDVIQKILEINPNYTITFEEGYVANDVLVAYIPAAH